MPPETVDQYIAAAPKQAQATLTQMRKAIRAAAPKAEEKIAYGIPTYRQEGMLVAFGAAKEHCGFYAVSDAYLAEHRDKLKPYIAAKAKSTLHFPFGKPIPSTLIRGLVKARIAENEAAAAAKKSRTKPTSSRKK